MYFISNFIGDKVRFNAYMANCPPSEYSSLETLNTDLPSPRIRQMRVFSFLNRIRRPCIIPDGTGKEDERQKIRDCTLL